MKVPYGFILVFATTFGCSASHEHTVVTPADVDFDTAIEILATSNDWDYVNSAQARLSYGGLPAIETLRDHLSDDRVIPTDYSTRAINSGTVTVGQQAFFTIQDMVERYLPYAYEYAVLTPNNVEDWLDRHQGKSLIELQIEATSTSLDHAKRDFELTGDDRLRDAIKVYRESLMELHRKAS